MGGLLQKYVLTSTSSLSGFTNISQRPPGLEEIHLQEHQRGAKMLCLVAGLLPMARGMVAEL